MKINFVDSIKHISLADWHKLNPSACPFLDYEFFKALEDSNSVSIASGWQPHHMTITDSQDVMAIMPLYIKQHSWGEYVFDWDWAQAYDRNNLPYYPKLVATIPFTPLTTNKLFSSNLMFGDICKTLIEHCQKNALNSWHILFTNEKESPALLKLPDDVYQRNTVQFHWFNKGYQSFDDFLDTFTSRKRKNTRKERLSISQQNLQIKRFTGSEITEKELDYFYLTYQITYLKKGHQPHLTYEFFKQIFTHFAENMLLIIASFENNYVACALFFFDDSSLYGRYWGCSEQFKNLHFELCYYQGIIFAIEHDLQCFNPGTQGEHKIQRGFEPVFTHSYHWIKHPAFKAAIKDFCHFEQQHMKKYHKQCQQALPFKKIAP